MSGNTFQNENFAVEDENCEIQATASRLKFAIENAGGNKAVSERASVPLSTLNGYIAGRDMKGSAAARLAVACNVSLEWLYFGTDQDARPASIIPREPDDVRIRFYDEAEASAGFGLNGVDGPAAKNIPVSRVFLEELGLKPHHTVILKARGDSMEPTLKSGDHLFLDTTPAAMLFGVHVFTLNGMLMVKRLAVTASGTVRVSSDNALYQTEEVPLSRIRWGQSDTDDTITIIGRVAYRLQALS